MNQQEQVVYSLTPEDTAHHICSLLEFKLGIVW